MSAPRARKTAVTPDPALLMARIESAILKGDRAERCRRILAAETVWRPLSRDHRLAWARLAEMAGETGTALTVLDTVCREHPDFAGAAAEREALRRLLGQPDRASDIPDDTTDDTPAAADIAAAAEPFDRLRQRRAAVARFMTRFAGRADCFARQWVNKESGKTGYMPVRRAMTAADVEDHLKGRRTYGIYLLRPDATVTVAAIDADLTARYRGKRLKGADARLVRRDRDYLFSRITALAGEMGLAPLIEFSGGKGYHFWCFFSSPIPAADARERLSAITDAVGPDLTAFSLEVFPKQDGLTGKGLGNLIKLPLGIHRGTGKPSRFVGCPDGSVDAQLAHLADVQPVDPGSLPDPADLREPATVRRHPRFEAPTGQPPDLDLLARRCPPLGRVLAACRSAGSITLKEEKVLFQTLGFHPKARTLLHHVMAQVEEYNVHLVDYKLSRLRGKPLGCRRIHSILDYPGDLCDFEIEPGGYPHPLRHLGGWESTPPVTSDRAETLNAALDTLKSAIAQVERLLPRREG